MPRKPEPLYTIERWHEEADAAERARIAAVTGLRSRGARQVYLDLVATEARVRAFLWGVVAGAGLVLAVATFAGWLV